MLDKVQFNPDGGNIEISIDFNQDKIVGSFSFTLWDPSNNEVVFETRGVTARQESNRFSMLNPITQNEGKLVQIRTDLVGLANPDGESKYVVNIGTWQGGKQIRETIDSKILTGGGQTSQIFIEFSSDNHPA